MESAPDVSYNLLLYSLPEYMYLYKPQQKPFNFKITYLKTFSFIFYERPALLYSHIYIILIENITYGFDPAAKTAGDNRKDKKMIGNEVDETE